VKSSRCRHFYLSSIFASRPIASVIQAQNVLLRALERRGYKVTVIQDGPTFCGEVVERLTLAHAPTVTVLGPTLPPLELAGRKFLALLGRAEASDFADVYVLAQRLGKDALLEQAQSLDAGFGPHVLAQMIGTLGRFTDDEIPLAASDVPLAKAFFSAWTEESCPSGLGLASVDGQGAPVRRRWRPYAV
jgi:CheY-like chemotaxis protein